MNTYEMPLDGHGVGPEARQLEGPAGGWLAFHAQELGSCPRAAGTGEVQAGGVEIVVEIHQGEDGRPTGTVRAAGSSEARSFSGNLEFIALVENLYRVDDCSTSPLQSPTKGRDDV